MNTPNLFLIYHGSWDESIVPSSWERLPFEKIEENFDKIIVSKQLDIKEVGLLKSKVEDTCKKLLMSWYGGYQAIEEEREFMTTQSRYGPALIWDSEIKVYYHLESMILLGRSALDLAAYIFSKLILGQRIDSFNQLRKKLLKNSDPTFNPLKQLIDSQKSINWVDLVSGTKSRSLRDKIAHQSTIHIEYNETNPNSDKEYCHVEIDGDIMPLEEFIEELRGGIKDFCLIMEDVILAKLGIYEK